MSSLIIRKVYSPKHAVNKLVTIPIDADIEDGDYVEIRKVKKQE